MAASRDEALADGMKAIVEELRRIRESSQAEQRPGAVTSASPSAGSSMTSNIVSDALDGLKEKLVDAFKAAADALTNAAGNIALGGGMQRVAGGELESLATGASRRHTSIAEGMQEMAAAHSSVGSRFQGEAFDQYQQRLTQRQILAEQNRRHAARATGILPTSWHDFANDAQDFTQVWLHELRGTYNRQGRQIHQEMMDNRGE